MRTRAVLTLLALGAIGLAGLRSPAPTAGPAATKSDKSDVTTYQAVVAGLRAGEPYYEVLGFELRRLGYPTRDAFNWRTPLLLRAVSAVPDAVGRGALLAFLVVLSCATLAAVRQPFTVVWTAAAQQLAVLAVSVVAPDTVSVVAGEAWAGVLVGVSVCAYALRRTTFAVALGLLALFVRELAAPYCVVCTIIAASNRRWRELAAWIGGACVYAVYYGWHLTQVWAHRLPTDLAHSSSWLEFGGLRSLQATIHWMGWWLVFPAPLTTLALVLIVGGIANARAPLHVRAASATYAVFFLVAGKPFNDYWGMIAGPTWALACGYGVQTMYQAMKAAFAPLRSSE